MLEVLGDTVCAALYAGGGGGWICLREDLEAMGVMGRVRLRMLEAVEVSSACWR